jgi:hypothetical protein
MYSRYLFSSGHIYMCMIYWYVIEVYIYYACVYTALELGTEEGRPVWDVPKAPVRHGEALPRVVEHFCLRLLTPHCSSRCLNNKNNKYCILFVINLCFYIYSFLPLFLIVYFPLQVKTKPHDGVVKTCIYSWTWNGHVQYITS